jgi:cytochrome c biogenesis protein CcmG, thiol:disulfide interchange protein DsbE
MTDETPGPTPPAERPRWMAYAVLGVAVVLAIAVGAYLLTSDDSNAPAASSPDAGDLRAALGDPTPAPNTGVYDPQRPKEGEKAPNFGLVDARDASKVVKLSDFQGKAVVVNFFASWCGPCKSEIPEFQRAQQQLGDQVVFLGVDYLESQSDAVSILDELKASYPAVLDSAGVVADHYRVGSGGGGLPTTFFIDKDGVLRASVLAPVTGSKLEEMLAKVGVAYKTGG